MSVFNFVQTGLYLDLSLIYIFPFVILGSKHFSVPVYYIFAYGIIKSDAIKRYGGEHYFNNNSSCSGQH